MITLSFGSWLIPTIITIGAYVWAIWIYDDGTSGYLSGIGNMFMLIPASIISMLAWMIWGILT